MNATTKYKKKYKTEPQKDDISNQVLVVGDWVVDEHWVVDDHRSASASRTGKRHSRALHLTDCSVRSLCGAGQVATTLHTAYLGSKRIGVKGLGVWRPSDTDELCQMLNPKNNVKKLPYQLSQSNSDSKKESVITNQLFSLVTHDADFPVSTTHIIRVYSPASGRIELIHRIDWEIPVPDNFWDLVKGDKNDTLKEVKAVQGIKHIVIKDIRKGAISNKLVDWLSNAFPDAYWYVSSKEWWPEWIENLPTDKVRLFLVPQLAAQLAVKEDDFSSYYWITPHGRATNDALKRVVLLARKFPKALIAILPDGMSVLARPPVECNSSKYGYIQSNKGDSELLDLVPMASVFFPSLVAKFLYQPDKLLVFPDTNNEKINGNGSLRENNILINDNSFLCLLQECLSFTNKWMNLEKNRLVYENWAPSDDQHFDAEKVYTGPFTWNTFKWETEINQWEEAFTKNGVISTTDHGQDDFHLWRAMIEVEGYVACVDSKRKILQELLSQGKSFSRYVGKGNTSFMLLDAPGSGKSYLVNRLSKALGMRFLPFNVTQLVSRADLLHCFDTVVTTQAQDPTQPVLVFFDEINALLDGHHVYDFFLAPLEDGIYVRSGNSFYIRPCFWIFAGTKIPSEDLKEKGTDFEDRLTLPPFDLKPIPDDPRETELSRLEKVYLGVAAIRSTFPDVRLISKYVLEVFRTLPGNVPPREIVRFVKSFEYIKFGAVRSDNLPRGWERTYKIANPSLEELKKIDEKPENLVAIYGDI